MGKENFILENTIEKQPTGLEALKNYLALEAKLMKQAGIPINSNGRIEAKAYLGFYPTSELKADEAEVAEIYKKIKEEEKESPHDEKRLGEQLELLATAVFSLYLKDKYYVLRSSEYDDLKHKVDTILFDKETGELICAFDEVSDASGKRFEQKKEEILNINRQRNGTQLKYGLSLDQNTGKVRPGRNKNVPIFYICVAPDIVKKTTEEFIPDPNGENNKHLFEYFLHLLSFEIKELTLKSGNLNKEMKKKLDSFEHNLKNYFLIKKNI